MVSCLASLKWTARLLELALNRNIQKLQSGWKEKWVSPEAQLFPISYKLVRELPMASKEEKRIYLLEALERERERERDLERGREREREREREAGSMGVIQLIN
jgi:hypothetical protein